MTTPFAGLLPRPHSLQQHAGSFVIPTLPTLTINGLTDAEMESLARFASSLPWPVTLTKEQRADFTCAIGDTIAPEEYALDISPEGITLRAGSYAGIVLGLQTLRQLTSDDATIPCCSISDRPAFAWRGAMLDVARHFLPKSEVLKHIQQLSSMKFNRLHLHLSDDQGWRIESKQYPRLHEIGSFRERTCTSHFFAKQVTWDETPHGGYYTQDDLREIVEYARDRGVTVIPEIDLPGHSTALLVAYPHLGSPVADRTITGGWGISDGLVAYTDESIAFLTSLLDEILDIAAFPYIHLGGDEANPT